MTEPAHMENLPPENIAPETFRAGHVALVGRPNIGKSTLLNALVGQPLAAVSHKAQTTRLVVRGILSGPGFQLVLEDTPGLLDPRSALDRSMLRLAHRTAAYADLVVAMARPWTSTVAEDMQMIESLPGHSPVVVAVNKIDLVDKPLLLPVMAQVASLTRVSEVVPVSATGRDGLDALVCVMACHVQTSPPLYPPDQVSDQPERFFVAEILREQIMLRYHEEVPYATAVEIEEFVERDRGKDYVRAVIWVERESQRIILVGKRGAALKALGIHARTAVEQLLDRPVYLELWVKVRPKWRDREVDLVRLGLGSAPSQ
ncbi:GTPase Era [Candidatus Fermentibacteria bacterium]|nr:GTPase Era [Candidatus Fermentibacteria bacterium]